jgi:hypothetical protein
MFLPEVVSHDSVVSDVIALADRVKWRDVANAFIVSLGSRRLDLRSALGSLAVACAVPSHRFVQRLGSVKCAVCGGHHRDAEEIDVSVFSFERWKWGGVARLDPTYVRFDLQRFEEWPRVAPDTPDTAVMRAMISRLSEAAMPSATPNDLETALTGLFPSNKTERRGVVEILAICGVVRPKAIPVFTDQWTNYNDRPTPPGRHNDWSFPAYAWRGSDGIDVRRAEEVFGLA